MSILSSDAKVFLPQRNINLGIHPFNYNYVSIFAIHKNKEVGPKELIRKLKADDPDKLIIGHLNINSIRNKF